MEGEKQDDNIYKAMVLVHSLNHPKIALEDRNGEICFMIISLKKAFKK